MLLTDVFMILFFVHPCFAICADCPLKQSWGFLICGRHDEQVMKKYDGRLGRLLLKYDPSFLTPGLGPGFLGIPEHTHRGLVIRTRQKSPIVKQQNRI
jgi:hypothetical protein